MYLKVSNSAPSAASPAALPTAVTVSGVNRGMGYVMRGAQRRGLGETPGCAPYDIVTQLNVITQDALNGLGYQIEQGTAASPATFAANLQSMAVALCSKTSFGCAADPCVVPTALIATLAAQYAAAFNSTMQQKAAQVAAGDICVPSLAMFPGIVLSDRAKLACGYGGAPVPAPASSSSGSSSSGPAPSGSAAPAGRPLGVTLQNATGPSNTQFRVGDTFRLVITGPANSQVTGSSQHDGRTGAAAPFGNTDSTGQAVITGTMTPDTVGGWVEQWFVAGQNAGSVSFSVAPPAGSTAPAPAGSSSSSGGGTAPPPAGGTTAPPPASGSGFNFSSLSQTATTVGGFDVPWWLLVVVGGGLLYAGSRGKG